MNDIKGFLLSEELIIVYTVVGVLLLGFIIFMITKKTYNYRKKRHNTKELNKLVTEVHDRIEEDKVNNKVNEAVKVETLEPIPEILENIKEEIDANKKEVDTMENNNINPVMGLKEGILIPDNDIIDVDVRDEELYQQQDNTNYQNNIEELDNPLIEQLDEIEVLEDEEDNTFEKPFSMPVEVVEIKPNIEKEIPKVEEEIPQVEDDVVKIQPKEVEKETEELEYEDEMDETKAQEEIEKLTKELVNANATVDNIELTNFEAEQEKNAIISLDEFLKLGDSLYDQNEQREYQDDQNVPISLEEFEQHKKENIKEQNIQPIEVNNEDINKEEMIKEEQEKRKENNMVLDDFYTIKTPNVGRNRTTKFQRSPIISPVYGIEKQTNEDNTMEIENTANYDKLDEEIRKTNEFLSTLRELQEKLD